MQWYLDDRALVVVSIVSNGHSTSRVEPSATLYDVRGGSERQTLRHGALKVVAPLAVAWWAFKLAMGAQILSLQQ